MLSTIGKGVGAVVAVVCLFSQNVHSWGLTGHEIVSEVGAKLTRKGHQFWAANEANMGHLATVPDTQWKRAGTREYERNNHWFQPDAYYSAQRDFDKIPRMFTDIVDAYGEEFVTENGTAIWRARQLMVMTVEALEKYNYKKVLQVAGTMSHYIGDLSQPLHVTMNHDGQNSNQQGIHKYFETTVVEAMDRASLTKRVEKAARALLNDPSFLKDFEGPIEEVLFNEVRRSYKQLRAVLKEDKAGRTKTGSAEMRALIVDRMADGAATIAILLSIAWEHGGDSRYSNRLTVADPSWIKNDFNDRAQPYTSMHPADDCY